MGFLDDFFKKMDKKKLSDLAVFFVIGVVLMICGNSFLTKQKEPTEEPDLVQTVIQVKEESSDSYEQALEKRLEEALGIVEGVGQVKVMVTLAYGREIEVAENTVYDRSSTKEQDTSGGSREIETIQSDTKKIIINNSGSDEPLVTKQKEPKVEGVIVVAEGGDNIFIKDTLVRAVQTVLGVEPHKVQVLKMK